MGQLWKSGFWNWRMPPVRSILAEPAGVAMQEFGP